MLVTHIKKKQLKVEAIVRLFFFFFCLRLIFSILFQMWDFVQFAVYRTNCFQLALMKPVEMKSFCLLSFSSSCPSFSHLSLCAYTPTGIPLVFLEEHPERRLVPCGIFFRQDEQMLALYLHWWVKSLFPTKRSWFTSVYLVWKLFSSKYSLWYSLRF